jgi:hypothetical protein
MIVFKITASLHSFCPAINKRRVSLLSLEDDASLRCAMIFCSSLYLQQAFFDVVKIFRKKADIRISVSKHYRCCRCRCWCCLWWIIDAVDCCWSCDVRTLKLSSFDMTMLWPLRSLQVRAVGISAVGFKLGLSLLSDRFRLCWELSAL